MYLAGLLLTVYIIIMVFIQEPSRSFENMASGDLLVIGMGIALIIVGRVIVAKLGVGMLGSFGGFGMQTQMLQQGNAPNTVERNLQHMGYSIPPEEEDGGTTSDAGSPPSTGKICSQCGEHNEELYRFCGNCSAKL